jgi:hypothetical protein
LGGVSIHPVAIKIQASFLTQLSGGKDNAQGFHQEAMVGNKFTFQQDNNLKHKAKSTLELLTKTTLNDSVLAKWLSSNDQQST